MDMLLTIDEIINRAIAFYNSLNIKVPTDKNRLAARSLILSQYANEYKQKFNSEENIPDHEKVSCNNHDTYIEAIVGLYFMIEAIVLLEIGL